MAKMDFRDLYSLDDPGSPYPSTEGLPGLLQRVLPQWRAQSDQPSSDASWLDQRPSRVFDGPDLPAWLQKNRLIRQLSSGPTDDDAASSRDSNFRQLVSRPQGRAKQSPDSLPSKTSLPLDRVAINVPPAGFGGRPSDGVTPQSPKDDTRADLIPVGGLSSIEGPDPRFAPSFWPNPRKEDVAAMWNAMRRGWENFSYHLNPNAPTTSDAVEAWPACILRPGLDVVPGQPIWPRLKARDAETSPNGLFHVPGTPPVPEDPASIPEESDTQLPESRNVPLPGEEDQDATTKLIEDLRVSFAKRAAKKRSASQRIIDQSYCAKRERREIARCRRRRKDTTHEDFYSACEERARKRRLDCDANDGYPDPNEKPQWGDKDEEIWLNLHR